MGTELSPGLDLSVLGRSDFGGKHDRSITTKGGLGCEWEQPEDQGRSIPADLPYPP